MLLLAIDKVVVVLHRDDGRELVVFCVVTHRHDCIPVSLDDVVESLHRLFVWRRHAEAIAVEDIDVVERLPLQAFLDRLEDGMYSFRVTSLLYAEETPILYNFSAH